MPMTDNSGKYKPLIVAFCCNWCSYAVRILRAAIASVTPRMLKSSVFPAHAE